MKLAEAFKALSAKLFPTVDGQRQPDYRAIFVEVASSILTDAGVKFSVPTLQAVADNINLSSFQRGAGAEAARRYGKMNEDGVRELVAKPEPKAKAPTVKAKRGVDPITGDKVKTKRAKAVDPITGEKPAKKETKSPAAKPAAPKKEAAKSAAPAKAKPAKKSAAVDPITGEPAAAPAK